MYRIGYHFPGTDLLVEDLRLEQGNRELQPQTRKKSTQLCFGWTVLVSLVVSEKQLL